MPLATLNDLTAYSPESATFSDGTRQLALDDAAVMIDARWFGDKCRRAHAMLALHYLSLLTGELGGEGGMVTSKNAGDISVSYAGAALTIDETLLSRTRWGRLYLEIARSVPHSGVSG